ncbi:LysR substrate-binding domain-containing protein [Pseudarthrobacter sp. NPDC057230]|uniref:LysR substrate-binding domain-containing protein n=1 Tax=Pseudarthrobacter sp. NPDC057230 TaxID=3346057 RepID=UPI00362787AD
MDPSIDLRHLRYFVAVAEELHFGRAARRLHMAQPPLSQQIRKLESMIGAQLFHRTSRAVSLTPAGQAFFERARILLSQLQADVEEAAGIGRGLRGRLDLGYVTSATLLGMPAHLKTFREQNSGVTIRLHENFTSRTAAALLDEAIDVGIVRDAEPLPGIVSTTIATENFLAVVPADHPLARRTSLRGEDLRGEPFVLYPRSAGERAFTRNLQPLLELGVTPTIAQESSNWTSILYLVGAGLGMTVAPESATIFAPPSTRVIPLEGTAVSEIQLLRRGDDDRALVHNFCSLITGDHSKA